MLLDSLLKIIMDAIQVGVFGVLIGLGIIILSSFIQLFSSKQAN